MRIINKVGLTLIVLIVPRPFPDRPRFQDASDLEPEIEMQARCMVLLADEPVPVRFRDFAFGLRRLREIAFLVISLEAHVCIASARLIEMQRKDDAQESSA